MSSSVPFDEVVAPPLAKEPVNCGTSNRFLPRTDADTARADTDRADTSPIPCRSIERNLSDTGTNGHDPAQDCRAPSPHRALRRFSNITRWNSALSEVKAADQDAVGPVSPRLCACRKGYAESILALSHLARPRGTLAPASWKSKQVHGRIDAQAGQTAFGRSNS